MADTDPLARVLQLSSRGYYSAALSELNRLPLVKSRSPFAEPLRVELLERTGSHAEAEALALKLLRSRALPPSHRSLCEFSLGLILWEKGSTGEAVDCFKRAVMAATDADDLKATIWSQLRLLVSSAGMASGEPLPPLLKQIRHNVVKLGDPAVTAALHILLGETEAKRGLLGVANRHIRLGLSLLRKTDHIWLEALAENNLAALAIMRSDLALALTHAQRSLALATESGAAATMRAALGNLGNISYLRGEFDSAREQLQRAFQILPSRGEHAHGSLDSLARIYLAERRLAEAEVLLSQIESDIATSSDRSLYANRYALFTRIELLIRTGRSSEALDLLDELVRIVSEVEDRSLGLLALARQAEATAAVLGVGPAIEVLNRLAAKITSSGSPSHIAEYEFAVGRVMRAAGRPVSAAHHTTRGARIYRTIRYGAHMTDSDTLESDAGPAAHDTPGARQLQELAATVAYADRPELVATGLLSCIEDAGCATAAVALSQGPDGSCEVLAQLNAIDVSSKVRVFRIGAIGDRTLELHVQPLPDLESEATVNSIGFVVGVCQELERARLAEEERLTLWPADELPALGDDSVVAGRMRDVMLSARKVADSRVVVLITGESGTGKEVVARAIHRYSKRSMKPFVPFNCTAVPRDLVESHLFGFKRGAFTGADRDNPGLIRTAKDGTLFLDEVGDLSLESQPKLLRFLESGEISPLGEGAPFPVNVHVVAATNANLKRLVEQGRFREDLYYRLNVYPIELPPLRQRREEIAPLARHFVLKWSHELGKGGVSLTPELIAHLELYSWPGNIRQLSHEIGRMVANADPNQELTPDSLPSAVREQTEERQRQEDGLSVNLLLTGRMADAVSTVERRMIELALRRHGGHLDAAAAALGISRKGLYLKRQRYGF